MVYITPVDVEEGLMARLKDGRWVAILKGTKVNEDLFDPAWLDLAREWKKIREFAEKKKDVAL
jgi:hypothetical protein